MSERVHNQKEIVEELPKDAIPIKYYATSRGVREFNDFYFAESTDSFYQRNKNEKYSRRSAFRNGIILVYDKENQKYQFNTKTFKRAYTIAKELLKR